MVAHVHHFEFIVTDSEFEALILECSLIKQYHPKYNILLKDDKGYHYIKITKGPWSRALKLPNKNWRTGYLYRAVYQFLDGKTGSG